MNPFSKTALRFVPLLAVAAVAGCYTPNGDTPAAQRDDIRAMREDSLQQAYAKWPELKDTIAKAPGYAVVDNRIIKILIVGTAMGYGVVTDASGGETFVNDFVIAVGPGIEIGTSRGIFVFHDPVAMKAFCDGQWDFGADADAAFKFGDFGGALTTHSVGGVIDTHRVFQLGVGLHASIFWFHSGIDSDYDATTSDAAK